MKLDALEPFTLVLWLMMGQRYEQTEIHDLHRAECRQLMAVMSDRARVKCIIERRNDRMDTDSRRDRLRRLRDL